MPKPPRDCYAHALSLRHSQAAFREESPPPERWLQQVWRHQRIRRDRLVTADGRRLQVLHPGFWNREPGPDFRGAVLQFGDDSPVAGDVELDLSVLGWRGHRHHENPAYRRVILHVVWEAEPVHAAGASLPVLALGPVLDAPLAEIAAWLSCEAVSQVPELTAGLCAGPLRGVAPAVAREILEQAALSRLLRKAAELEARARHGGWEQALWEALFGALGYKHNVWPMRRLAEILRPGSPAVAAALRSTPVLQLQARLLGLASFLPSEFPRQAGFVRGLWDFWWREQAEFQESVIPRATWRLAGIRPANHPHRRLALAAHWLAGGQIVRRLEDWIQAPMETRAAALEFQRVLQPEDVDGFWGDHWTLVSRRRSGVGPLLGIPRATDLAMNAVLPWLWIRARLGRDERLKETVERRFLEWPAGEDNSVLRLARDRLFGGTRPKLPRTAALQQGVMQVVRDFCDHSNAICAECQFPALVKALGN